VHFTNSRTAVTEGSGLPGFRGVRGSLDFGRPVCLLLDAMLHFVPDGPDLRAALRRAVAVAERA
jgi:hypothetical protein